MAKIEVIIGGKAYPCRTTMGAMLRFKRETGKEVTEMTDGVSDMCTFLWCCVVSSCKADGIPFDMELMDFADSLSQDDLNEWAAKVQEENKPPEGEGQGKN